MFYLGAPHGEIPRAKLFTDKPVEPRPIAVIHPIASLPEKTWPEERFTSIAEELRKRWHVNPIFIGAAGDDFRPFRHFDTLVGAPLSEVKSLIASAAVFIGNEEKVFVIYVDESVGAAISMFMNGTPKERPLTHDLIGHIFLGLGVKLEIHRSGGRPGIKQRFAFFQPVLVFHALTRGDREIDCFLNERPLLRDDDGRLSCRTLRRRRRIQGFHLLSRPAQIQETDARGEIVNLARMTGGEVFNPGDTNALADGNLVTAGATDPVSAAELDALLNTLRRALGLTLVLVTHDLDSLFTVTDRVAYLGQGRVLEVAPPRILSESREPEIARYFGNARAQRFREEA